MKRMLFNATQAEELRVAIVDGQKLIDLDIESAAKEQRKSNIYKAVITRIEPSLEACFVNYGEERHGFLPFKEVSRIYFSADVDPGRARINEALREGQELLVQVDKDERGNKGAALTTYISLAGRYLVLMPNNPRGGGVSRRVEGDDRAELRQIIDQLEVPAGMSLIARTAAIGRGLEELQWDMNYLLQLWAAIDGASSQQAGPFLIYLEGSLVIRAIRDYFQADIGEILIDTDEIYEQARAFMGTVMPASVNCVKRYRDDVPLFSRFQIEHQIESAYARQVTLPSGGAIVIDHTEALVAVDVNSGRATKGSDIEETALRTNLESADELARQLRLRDLGGLIVIDFIDMESQKNQREVENRLRDGLRFDRARVQMGKISRFGLMELSRQRLRPALAETSYIPCPRCTGTGHIRSTESAALHILRILEEEAMKDGTRAVHAQVPVDVATFLLNEKRSDVAAIEHRHKVAILLIPNIHLETPQHSIERLRHDDLGTEERLQPSYKMAEQPEQLAASQPANAEGAKPRQEAAIKQFTPDQPAPLVADKTPQALTPPPRSGGLFSRIAAWFSGGEAAAPLPPKPMRQDGGRGGRNSRDGRHRAGRSDSDSRNPRREGGRNEAKPQGHGRSEQAAGQREAKEIREPREGMRKRQGRADTAGDQARHEPGEEKRPSSPRGDRKDRQALPPAIGALAPDSAAANHAADQTQRSGTGHLLKQDGNSESPSRGRRGRRGRRGERPNEAETIGQEQHQASPSESPSASQAHDFTAATHLPTDDERFAESPTESVPSSPAVQEVPVWMETKDVEATSDNTFQSLAAQPPSTEVAFKAPQQVTSSMVSAPIAAPAVAIDDILKDSGMTMIETNHSLLVGQPPLIESPSAPRRARRTPTVLPDEPMQQVETQA